MKHLLNITWQHARRSPYQALAAVMIMTFTIFVGILFFMLSVGSAKLLTYLERKPQVIAFFNDTVISKDQITDLITQLKVTGKTEKINFVTKEEALQIYKDRNKSDPLLLELVSANTLPASLEVSAKNISDLPYLYEIIKTAPNIEDISYQKDVVGSLVTVLDKVRKGGLGLVVFLAITSLFTILTIIGMKISLRKDEIEVEKLVGASTNYVRLPFLLEGFFYGLFGAVISWTIIYIIILAITPYLTPYFSQINLFPISPLFMLLVLGGAIFIGCFLGILGSFLAVWRYLID